MRAVIVILVFASSMSASPSEPTRADLLKTVEHIQRLAKDQQAELDAGHKNEIAVQEKLITVQDRLIATQGNLGTAQGQLITVQEKINVLAQHDANETADKKHILGKYHKLKAIACAIAAAAAIFIVMRLTSFIPAFIAPYKIYLYAGAGVIAATMVATLL